MGVAQNTVSDWLRDMPNIGADKGNTAAVKGGGVERMTDNNKIIINDPAQIAVLTRLQRAHHGNHHPAPEIEQAQQIRRLLAAYPMLSDQEAADRWSVSPEYIADRRRELAAEQQDRLVVETAASIRRPRPRSTLRSCIAGFVSAVWRFFRW